MPLDAEGEVSGGPYADRLDSPVGGVGFHRKAVAEPADRLAVERVHAQSSGAEDLRQHAAGFYFHVLADGEAQVVVVADRRAMVAATGEFLHLGDERAAMRDVQLLHAAADGEEWHAVPERGGDQRQRDGVAARIVRQRLVARRCTVAERLDVGAASRQ